MASMNDKILCLPDSVEVRGREGATYRFLATTGDNDRRGPVRS